MKKFVEDFIKEHTYIDYCEAIIHIDGTIEYVKPSHVETLLKITGEPREEIYSKMPIWDSPIIWLVNYTGCISVWSNGYVKPKFKECTEKQEEALEKLIKNNLVAPRDILGII